MKRNRGSSRKICILLRQMRYKWAVALFLWLSLYGVVALYTYARNSSRFQNRSMQLIMKDLGHNLWFLDESASLAEAVSGSPGLPSFSDRVVHDLAGDRGIASTYWANVLQSMVSVNGRDMLLTGFEPVDDHQVTEEKSHLMEPLAPGSAALGHAVAAELAAGEGEVLSFWGRDYRIDRIHPRRGNTDDLRLWVPLADAQERLGMPGRANLIMGFYCMQGRPLEAGLERLDNRIKNSYPGMKVIPLMNLLEARALARLTTSRYLNHMLYSIAAITGLLIAVIGWMEINERRYELSVMLAIGAGYGFILLLFLGKLLLLCAAAAAAGFITGSFLSVAWMSPVLVTHTQPVAVVWADFPGIFARALLLAGAAAFLPILHLLQLEPARILAEE